MKTIITLLTSIAFSFSVLAADRPSGNLFVSSNDRGDVRVVLDGKQFTSADNVLMIPGIRAGLHDVKIYHQKNMGLLGILLRNYELVYAGNISVKPGKQTSITIDRFGRTNIDEQKIRDNRKGDRDDEKFDSDHHDGDRDGKYSSDNSYGDYRFSQVMSNRDFDLVLQSIQREWFENNKMESARQIITTNYFTSEQVKEMIQLFNFENNKLELAKLAYKKTVDPENYRCVIEQLTFSSNKAELSRYIQDCR
jgi:hypothetical protein